MRSSIADAALNSSAMMIATIGPGLGAATKTKKITNSKMKPESVDEIGRPNAINGPMPKMISNCTASRTVRL